jgi:hypothetical protein
MCLECRILNLVAGNKMHPFIPKSDNPKICLACHRNVIDHTDKAECDVCGITGRHELLNVNGKSQLLCDTHYSEIISTQKAEKELILQNKLNHGPIPQIDTLPDFFNAEVQSIVDLKDEILKSGVENPNYEHAKQIRLRHTYLQEKLISLRKEESETLSRMRGIETRWNDLANKLRKDEQDELKLKNLEYKPISPKEPKAPSVKKPSRKYDKNELIEVGKKYGIPYQTIQSICITKNCSAEEAIKILGPEAIAAIRAVSGVVQ